jgi:outer membrane protein assembly factor BamB
LSVREEREQVDSVTSGSWWMIVRTTLLRIITVCSVLAVPAAVATLAPAVSAAAATALPDPTTPGAWALAGNATVTATSPPTLQLTSASGGQQAGIGYYPTAVSGAGVTATFDAVIGGGTGADGMTFMLADASAHPPVLGVLGGGLGFSGNTGLAVALDTYQNAVNPSNNFVGVATGAGPSADTLKWAATTTNVPPLRGTPVHVVVATSSTGLTVTVNSTLMLTYTGAVPTNVYVGFTGGDGGLTDRHAVENVTITANPAVFPIPAATSVQAMYLANNARTGVSASQTAVSSTNAAALALNWTAATGPATAQGNFPGASAQPEVVGGVAYWGDWNGWEHATNTTTGAPIWSTNLGYTDDAPCVPPETGISSTATVATVAGRNEVFVGGGDANLYALDASSGAVIWKLNTGPSPSTFVWSSPLVVNGNVYIGIASFGDCPLVHGGLIEADAATGVIKAVFFTDQQYGNGNCLGADVASSPTYDPTDNSIYVDTGNPNDGPVCSLPLAQAIVKLNATTLALEDSWQVPAAQAIGDGDFLATPTLFTGTVGGTATPLIGAVNKDGYFYAWRRSSLSAGPVWQTQVAFPGGCPECASGGSSIVPAAFDGTRLYLGGGQFNLGGTTYNGTAVALNPSTGAVIWQVGVSQEVLAAGTLSSDVFVFGDAGGTLHIVRADTGAQLRTIALTGPIYGAVAVDGSHLYVPTGAGTLAAYG